MRPLEPNRALVRLQTDMRNARGLASALALAASTLAWSPPAAACGDSGISAGLLSSFLIVLLMSIVSLLSMRAAVRAVGRMRRVRDTRGLWMGHAAAVLGLVIAWASTVVSGGLFLAFVLLLH